MNILLHIRSIFFSTCTKLMMYVIVGLLGLQRITHAQNVGGGGADSPTGLVNPLEANSITEFLVQMLEIILVFALPVVIFFIIYAGFKFVTAQGDTNKLTEARRAFVWAVVGGVIVLGAMLIVDVIQGTVDAL